MAGNSASSIQEAQQLANELLKMHTSIANNSRLHAPQRFLFKYTLLRIYVLLIFLYLADDIEVIDFKHVKMLVMLLTNYLLLVKML